MTYTIDNINEFFENLMDKPNAQVHMWTTYGIIERENERNKKIAEIIKQYNNFPSYYYDAVLINEDIAIVIEMKRGEITGYFAHVNGKKSHCIWPTFEQALLCAISIKLTGCEEATEWMWKLVGGN